MVVNRKSSDSQLNTFDEAYMPLQKLINHMIEEEQPCISNIIANSGFIFNFFQTALTLA